MNYVERWQPLSKRIRAMILAGTAALQRSDGAGSIPMVAKHVNAVLKSLEQFQTSLDPVLAGDAIDCINALIAEVSDRLKGFGQGGPDVRNQLLSSILTRFDIFDCELEYYLFDSQAAIKSRSELAFVHLQRLIAVDQIVQRNWGSAFADREERCEALGAVHLLSHGIWAFKAQASGARTDLVFQEPVNLAKAQSVAEGLVLTEWKKAESPDEAEKKFAEAREQASRYVGGIGVFAGNELRGYRYAVVVTNREAPEPNDWQDPNSKVVYRHINIAVTPRTPSKATS